MSRLTWAGLFAGLFLIQSAVLPFLFSGRWMPDLWFCAIIISVLAFNRKTALAFAVAGGIAQDIVTGNLFGLHLFPYLALALLTAAFMRERYNRRWLVSVASVAVGTAVYLLFVCAITALSGDGFRSCAICCTAGFLRFWPIRQRLRLCIRCFGI